ncbi:hypothetical protein, conserved [Plasmodium gonderi]|uniref:Potassium channel n=1 Tax=Plasmodium gonderi TaxID=77519 RepID=A0A1Y1JN47_PLAGO|nr:hypothetical protein, conserved [Plasmodium gonderi]GAW82875.1 hypothetical protein, conserved [Plasmodium gonderi]
MITTRILLERVVFVAILVGATIFFIDFMKIYDVSIGYKSFFSLLLIYIVSYFLAILPEISNSIKYTLLYKTRKQKIYSYSLKKDESTRRKNSDRDLKLDHLIDTNFLYMNQDSYQMVNCDNSYTTSENCSGDEAYAFFTDKIQLSDETSSVGDVNKPYHTNIKGTSEFYRDTKRRHRKRGKQKERYRKNDINDYVLNKRGKHKKYIIDSCEEFEKICLNDQRKTLKMKDKIIKYIELNDSENSKEAHVDVEAADGAAVDGVAMDEMLLKFNGKNFGEYYNPHNGIDVKANKKNIGSFLYDTKYLNIQNEEYTEENIRFEKDRKKYLCFKLNNMLRKQREIKKWKTSYFSGFRSNTNMYTLHSFYDRNKHIPKDTDFSRWHNLLLKLIVNIQVVFVKFCKNTSFIISDLIITLMLHIAWLSVYKYLQRNNVDTDTGMFNWNTESIPAIFTTIEGYIQYFILYDMCIKFFLFFSAKHILSFWFLLNLMNSPFLYILVSYVTNSPFKKHGWLYLTCPFRFLNFLRIENLFGQSNNHNKINFPVITLSIQILVVIYTYACIHFLIEQPCRGDYQIYDYIFSGMQTVSTAAMGRGTCFPYTLQAKITHTFYIFMIFTYIHYKIRYLKNHMVEEKKIYGKIPNIGARYFVIIGHIKPISLYVIINELQSTYNNLDEIIFLTSLPVKFYLNIIRLLNKKGSCQISLCLYDLNKPFPLKIKKIISYSRGIFICNNVMNTHHNINNDMETLKRHNEITSLGPFNKYISVLLNNMCNHNILLKRSNRNVICLNELKMKLFAKTLDDCPGMFFLILLFFINTPQKLKSKYTYILSKYFNNLQMKLNQEISFFASSDEEDIQQENHKTKQRESDRKGVQNNDKQIKHNKKKQCNFKSMHNFIFKNNLHYSEEDRAGERMTSQSSTASRKNNESNFCKIEFKTRKSEREENSAHGRDECNRDGCSRDGWERNKRDNAGLKENHPDLNSVHFKKGKSARYSVSFLKRMKCATQNGKKKKIPLRSFLSHDFDENICFNSYNNYMHYIKGIRYNIYKIKLPCSFLNFHFISIVQYMYMNYNAFLIGIINKYDEIVLNPVHFVYNSLDVQFILLTDKYNILQKIQNTKKVQLDWLNNIDYVKIKKNEPSKEKKSHKYEISPSHSQHDYYIEMNKLKNQNGIYFNPVLNIFRVDNYLLALEVFRIKRGIYHPCMEKGTSSRNDHSNDRILHQQKRKNNPPESLNYESLNSESLNSESLNSKSLNSKPLNYESLNSKSLNSKPLNYESLNYESLNSKSLNAKPLNSKPLNSESLNLHKGEASREERKSARGEQNGEINHRQEHGCKESDPNATNALRRKQKEDFILLIYWPQSINTFLKVLHKRKKHNIIILSDQIPSYIHNNKLPKYNICYIQKSPLILFNLILSGILCCKKCIIFKNYLKLNSHHNIISYNEKAENINYFDYMCERNDSDLIIIFNNIQNIFRRRDINDSLVDYYIQEESTEKNRYDNYLFKKKKQEKKKNFENEHVEGGNCQNVKEELSQNENMDKIYSNLRNNKNKNIKRNIYLLIELNNTLSVQYLNNEMYTNVDILKKKRNKMVNMSKAHNLLFIENYKKQIHFFKYGNLLVENIYKKIEHIFVDNYYFYLYFLQFTSASVFIDELIYHFIGYTFPIKNNSLSINTIEAFINGTYADTSKTIKTDLLLKNINPKYHSRNFFFLFQKYLKRGSIIIGIYRCNEENNMNIVIPCPQRNFIMHRTDKVYVIQSEYKTREGHP